MLGSPDLPLPADKLQLQASRLAGGEVLLRWEAQRATNAAYFELERSTDDTTYIPIAHRLAEKEIYNQSYDYTDPRTGNAYYRVRLVDEDGTSSLSNEVYVNSNSNADSYILHPQPNPATETVHLPLPIGQPARVEVWNSLGQLVQAAAPQDTPFISLHIAHWAQGVYTLRVTTPTHTYTARLLKE